MDFYLWWRANGFWLPRTAFYFLNEYWRCTECCATGSEIQSNVVFDHQRNLCHSRNLPYPTIAFRCLGIYSRTGEYGVKPTPADSWWNHLDQSRRTSPDKHLSNAISCRCPARILDHTPSYRCNSGLRAPHSPRAASLSIHLIQGQPLPVLGFFSSLRYQIYDGIKLKLCANKKPADLRSAGFNIFLKRAYYLRRFLRFFFPCTTVISSTKWPAPAYLSMINKV